MFPEDRVIVGVISRKRDLEIARNQHWYRIPQIQMPHGVNTEYTAFFLSGRAFRQEGSAIRYYASCTGLELVYRRDLLPEEADHPRAGEAYYKVQIDDLVDKVPPVLNPTRRRFSFIYTTWDRFVHSREIADLYSKADYFVDRVYHALRTQGIETTRYWDAERRTTGQGAHLRILCENGTVVAGTDGEEGSLFLDDTQQEDSILTAIKAAIARHGGAVTIGIPLEGR